jgi:hypothetical protein
MRVLAADCGKGNPDSRRLRLVGCVNHSANAGFSDFVDFRGFPDLYLRNNPRGVILGDSGNWSECWHLVATIKNLTPKTAQFIIEMASYQQIQNRLADGFW